MSEQPAEPQPQTSALEGNSLQVLRDKRQHLATAAAASSAQRARRQELAQRLTAKLKNVVSFAGGQLASEQCPRSDNFFTELASALLAFNEALNEADQEYPRYRIRERLNRAAQAGVPALDTAASLLLLVPDIDPAELGGELEALQSDRPRDEWLLWLTYICDQLLNSHNLPAKNNVPPNTSRDQWRKAELAFGCVLFSDDSFRVMQASVDQAVCLVDDALRGGGYVVLDRPPARVRDLIAQFDPRALHWYASESPPMLLLQPPPSIQAITEPESLRRQLDEVWTAANCLQIALDRWAAWFVELQERGDALPGIALNCDDMARRSLKVLLTHRPNVEPFDRADEVNLQAMLPPIPAWWMPGANVETDADNVGLLRQPRVSWQEDRELWNRYYSHPERLQKKSGKLRAAAAQLIDLLKSFPVAALVREMANRDCTHQPALADEAVGARRDQAESRASRPKGIESGKPGYPKPPVERLVFASKQLAEVEQYIAPESAVLASLLVRALLARSCTTAEAMWAIFNQLETGRYKATLLSELPRTVNYIVCEGTEPAGLNLASGVLHIDGEAGDWGLLVITLPKPDDKSTEEQQGSEAGSATTPQAAGDGDANLGRLLRTLEESEHAFVANSRTADRVETEQGGIAAHWSRIQAAALKFHPDPAQMPGIDRIEILCDELAGGTGLTVTNVRLLRARLCRLKRCSSQEADAYLLAEVADALEEASLGAEVPADQTTEPAAIPPQAVEVQTQTLPLSPTLYLMSWREILDALDQKNNAENQRRVRQLNKQFDGPIALPGKGRQPRVNKDKLLSWWNGLEERFQEIEQKQTDTQATLQSQHDYGKDAKVLPDISGHIKKRRGKKSDQ